MTVEITLSVPNGITSEMLTELNMDHISGAPMTGDIIKFPSSGVSLQVSQRVWEVHAGSTQLSLVLMHAP